MSKERQILKLRSQGFSQRRIADALKVSRNTVAKVFAAAGSRLGEGAELADMGDKELNERLFPKDPRVPGLVAPDHERIHKELLKSGVTLKMLWEEYAGSCRDSGKPPYMYSQFCKLYQDYVNRNRLSMHIRHKPGDKLMVDWAGTAMPLHDKLTGMPRDAYLFVATLPFSMYCYVEACLTMKAEDWINAHIGMYEFFGASTRLLIPDNLKTGILSHRKYEDPVANRSYQELADHYQTALLPTRVLAPKDKAAVEGAVKSVTTHVVARLRDRKFFNINEMNAAIRKELERFNRNEFQKKDGSRHSVFMEEELPFMRPLPLFPYEFAQWKVATVQMNYHIALDHQNYSVPCEYVRRKVDVRHTRNTVEIYYKGSRICSHRRLRGRRGQYSTSADHMPLNHRLYSEWDSGRFVSWADGVGEATGMVVRKMFEAYRVEEQAYKGCLSLLKLADKYTPERLESACGVALDHIPSPRYKNIRLILESGQDKNRNGVENTAGTAPSASDEHAFIRGAAYYGGGGDEK
jgi:transposase